MDNRCFRRFRGPIVPALFLFTLLFLLLTVLGCGSSQPAGTSSIGISGTVTLVRDIGPSSVYPSVPTAPAVNISRAVTLPNPREAVIADQLVVRFKESVSPGEAQKILESHSVDILDVLKDFAAYKVKIRAGQDRAQIMGELKAESAVESVTENKYRIRPAIAPDDPLFSAQQWNLPSIGLPQTWDMDKGSFSVRVAVIDGCFFAHNDLNYDTANGYDFFHNSAFQFETENPDFAHGTHVAGIIGALTDNGLGVAGVNWQVDIIPITIFGYQSGTLTCTDDFNVARAIQWAIDKGANIINMSWGSPDADSLISDALLRAYQRGITLVAAAGNDGDAGGTVSFPARLSYVIAVGATDSANHRASFSSYGTSRRYLDLMGPGVNILSTVAGNNYEYYSGTSMATPHVAGVAALLYASGITSPDAMKEYLTKTCTDIAAPGVDKDTGWGVVNAFEAVGMAKMKILLINNITRNVIETVNPSAGGGFQFSQVANGTDYRIGAWLDINGDNLLDDGDYYGEYDTTVSFAGGSLNVPNIPVSIYHGGVVLNL